MMGWTHSSVTNGAVLLTDARRVICSLVINTTVGRISENGQKEIQVFEFWRTSLFSRAGIYNNYKWNVNMSCKITISSTPDKINKWEYLTNTHQFLFPELPVFHLKHQLAHSSTTWVSHRLNQFSRTKGMEKTSLVLPTCTCQGGGEFNGKHDPTWRKSNQFINTRTL